MARINRMRLVATLILAGGLLPATAGLALNGANAADGRDITGRLVAAARARTTQTKFYDPAYTRLAYPGGDVANDRGVCTDVVVRTFRAIGVDLQKQVHEDMRRAFRAYPKRWGLTRPDSNIDHRRVPNLRTFLTRAGAALTISSDASSYQAGDLVTWDLKVDASPTEPRLIKGGRRIKFAGTPHIGIVSDRMSADGKRPLIIHNIGFGTQEADVLFAFGITGHYRYLPD